MREGLARGMRGTRRGTRTPYPRAPAASLRVSKSVELSLAGGAWGSALRLTGLARFLREALPKLCVRNANEVAVRVLCARKLIVALLDRVRPLGVLDVCSFPAA